MKVRLTNGKEIEVKENLLDDVMKVLIKEILIPHYQKNNDSPETIQTTIQETKLVFKTANIDKYNAGFVCLDAISNATGKEIAELTGKVNTVEILFQDVDDYLQEIKKIMQAKYSEEKTRLDLALLIEKLNRFEIVELILALSRVYF